MFGTFGFTELILILVIVLIIFGAGKLPQLGEGLGKAIKGFKKSVNEAEAMDVEGQTQTPGEPSTNTGAPAQISASSQTQETSTPPQPNDTTAQVQRSGAVSTSKA